MAALCRAAPCRAALGARLLAVFALHNAEELVTSRGIPLVDDVVLARVGLDRGQLRTDRLALAMAVLTGVAGAVLTPGIGPGIGPGRGRVFVHGALAANAVGQALVAGALAANAVAHLGRAALTRRWNPGLATALPLGVVAGRALVQAGAGRRCAPTSAAAAGALMSVPAAVLALRLARRCRPR